MTRSATLNNWLSETVARVEDLESGKGDEVGLALTALGVAQKEAIWEAGERLKVVEARLKELRLGQDKGGRDLQHQVLGGLLWPWGWRLIIVASGLVPGPGAA